MTRFHDSVVFHKNNDFKAYNGKNNNKNNRHYNSGKTKLTDLCPRLRILFVSDSGPDQKCVQFLKGPRKRYIKREAAMVSLFMYNDNSER